MDLIKVTTPREEDEDVLPKFLPFDRKYVSVGAVEIGHFRACRATMELREVKDRVVISVCNRITADGKYLVDFHVSKIEGNNIMQFWMMTPKVVSIVDKYVKIGSDLMEVTNSSCSGDGGQSITKRKKLREALLRQCEELDEICHGASWVFPRYTVFPSVSDGMFHASVRLRCPDFEMTINGAPRPNPREARCSAAANMILELHKKAKEEDQ
ncbi:hypothetical protein ZWY2020_036309 [Hordeum vulgare]|nr:hypothetical protein ZWY2020_036309 [Hordeum vulgare]